MTPEQIASELRVLYFVREFDPDNVSLAKRIAGLEKARGDWAAVAAVLEPYEGVGDVEVLRELGGALCKSASGDEARVARGRALLERAGSEPFLDAQALSALGVTWRGIDDEKAQSCFRAAFEIAPADPYVLDNHLAYEITATRNTAVLSAAEPVIRSAVAVCRERAAVGVDLPWSRFSAARFDLFLRRPLEALNETARGVACASEEQMRSALASIDRLRCVRGDLEGWEWVRRLLVLGLAARFPSEKSLALLGELATPGAEKLAVPVAILAGTCDPLRAAQIEPFRRVIVEGFRRYRGTLVGGGTTQGVSGFVGDISERNAAVFSVAYLPKSLPHDATRDDRYSEIRVIDDNGFTPLGPLQAWIDIVASGIKPADVVLIGIEGGPIAAAEYRIARALGATVALFEDGGRATAGMESDSAWGECGRLAYLPADTHAVTALLEYSSTSLDPDTRERLGRIVHERYRAKRLAKPDEFDKALAEWSELDEKLKESCRKQSDDMAIKMDELGLIVEPIGEGEAVEPLKLEPEEIERLAVMEHARWMVERLLEGWRYGPKKDIDRKISPHLVAWEELPEEVREYDRDAVAGIPETLAQAGLKVRRP